MGRFLSNKPINIIGKESYSLYLWHQPILAFYRNYSPYPIDIYTISILLVIIFLVAKISYKYGELNFLNHLNFNNQKLNIIYSASIAVCAAFGIISFYSNGFNKRISEKNSFKDLLKNPHLPLHNSSCDQKFNQFNDFSSCLISKNTAPEILILGDSHAQQYYKSLADALPEKSIMNLSRWSCLPFSIDDFQTSSKYSSIDCSEKLKIAYEFILNSKSIKTVILAGYWGYLASGDFKISNRHYRIYNDLNEEKK